MTNYIARPSVYVILEAAFGTVPLGVILAVGMPAPRSITVLILGLMTGVLLSLSTLFYSSVLTFGDVTAVSMILQVGTPLTILVGILVFGEQYTSLALVGMGIVTASAIGTSLLSSVAEPATSRSQLKSIPTTSRVVIVALLAVLFLTASYSLQKYLTNFADLKTIYALGRMGTVMIAVPLVFVPRVRIDLLSLIPSLSVASKWQGLLAIGGVQGLNLLAMFLTLAAYAHGPLALTATIGAMQPLFVVLLLVLLGRFVPNLRVQTVPKSRVVAQTALAIVLALGVYLLRS